MSRTRLKLLVVGTLLALFAQLGVTGTSASAASSDTVYRWGSYLGGLGFKQGSPTAVPGLSGVTQLAASNSSNYALLSDGTVWAWGDDRFGQLGEGKKVRGVTTTPVQVRFPAGTVIKSIGEGRNAGYAVDETGQGWAWGAFTCNPRSPTTLSPVQVPGLSGLVAVSGGGGHVIWLASSGAIFTCGTNSSGQLGDGKTRSTLGPVAVTGLPAGNPAVAISSGSSFSLALLADGEVLAWGKGNRGQLGDGSIGNSDVPREVKLPAGLHATQVYAGGDVAGDGQAVALLSNHEAVAWGADSAGQLGDGKRVEETSPVPVSLPVGVSFSFVASAGLSSYAIDTQGNLWAWGSNAEGQVGDHLHRSVSTPVKVDSGVQMVSSTARDVIDSHG